VGGSCRHLQEVAEVQGPLGEPVPGDPAGRRVNLVAIVVHPDELCSDQVGPGPSKGVEDQGLPGPGKYDRNMRIV